MTTRFAQAHRRGAWGLLLVVLAGCGPRSPLPTVAEPVGVAAQSRPTPRELLILPEALSADARAVSAHDPTETVTEPQAMAALQKQPDKPVAFWQFQSRLMRTLAKRYPTAAEGAHYKWYGHETLTMEEAFRTGIPARPKADPGSLLKLDLFHHQQDHAANDGLRGSCLTPFTPHRFTAGKGRVFKLVPLGGTIEMARAIPNGRLVPWEVEYVMGAAQPAFVIAGALQVTMAPSFAWKHIPSFRKRLRPALRHSPVVDRFLEAVRNGMTTEAKQVMARHRLGADYVIAPSPNYHDYVKGWSPDDIYLGMDIATTLQSTAEEACVIQGTYTPNPNFRPAEVASLR